MRRRFRCTGALGVALLILSTTAFASVPENDANQGSDASDLRASPTIVAAGATYAGTLHAVERERAADQDWYATPAANANPSCLKVSGRALPQAGVTLANGENTLTTALGNAQWSTFSLAGSGTGTAVGVINTDPARWHGYQFSMRSVGVNDLGAADAGTGRDAGATTSSAIAVAPGCVSGVLTPTALDTTDAYTIAGNAGDRVVLSLAAASGAPVTLRLFDPNGMPLGSPISPDGLLDLTLPVTGTYTMSASSSSLGLERILYIIGAVLRPPPCDPSC